MLDADGVAGLEGRLRGLMRAYQAERAELTADDETLEVVRGLVHLAMLMIVRVLPGLDPARVAGFAASEHVFNSAALLEAVLDRTPDGLFAALRPHPAAIRVGLIAKRLRLRQSRGPAPDRERGWAISVDHVARLARAYGVPNRLDNLPDLQANLAGRPADPP